MSEITPCETGKQSYGSRVQARRHASKFRKRKGDGAKPYLCGLCGSWHLSSRGNASMKAARRNLKRRGRS